MDYDNSFDTCNYCGYEMNDCRCDDECLICGWSDCQCDAWAQAEQDDADEIEYARYAEMESSARGTKRSAKQHRNRNGMRVVGRSVLMLSQIA